MYCSGMVFFRNRRGNVHKIRVIDPLLHVKGRSDPPYLKMRVIFHPQFFKTQNFNQKAVYLRIHSKFQLNRSITAAVTVFQRKSIILFEGGVVTLNTVRNYLGCAQIKGVSPMNSFT